MLDYSAKVCPFLRFTKMEQVTDLAKALGEITIHDGRRVNYFELCPVECITDVFHYLDTRCQKKLRRVCASWYDILEQPCLVRKVHVKDRILFRHHGLPTRTRLAPLIELVKRNTTAVIIEGSRTADPAMYRFGAVIGEWDHFPAALEKVVFVGGSVSCQTLIRLLSRELDVVLKNVVIHGFVANRQVVCGFHVYMHDAKILGGPFGRMEVGFGGSPKIADSCFLIQAKRDEKSSREDQVMDRLWTVADGRLSEPDVKKPREIAFYHLHRRGEEEIRDAAHAEHFIRKLQPELVEKINTPGTSFYLHYFKPKTMLEQLLIAVRDGRNYCCPFVKCCPVVQNKEKEKQRNWLLHSYSDSAYTDYEKVSRYRSGLIVYESVDESTGTRCLHAT